VSDPIAPALNAGETDQFVFNGINGATGEYLTPPMSAAGLARLAQADPSIPANPADQRQAAVHFRQLQARAEFGSLEYYGVRYGTQPDSVESAGWCVVFPQTVDPYVVQALRPLLDLRKGQAGAYYREFGGDKGYRTGESKDAYLARLGQSPGPADRDKVPYYVLLVGDPETIPYSVQYQLDVHYAVGRLWFDTIDEYARYAQSVVMSETGKAVLPRKVAVFAPQNADDRATALSATQLAAPLAAKAAARVAGRTAEGWAIESAIGADATHARLAEYLGGAKTPSLLFTASHGMGFPLNDPRQLTDQGALLCQDWPGPTAMRVDRGHYFARDDVSDNARLMGLIGFHFACYGAGTPRLDDFAHQQMRTPAAVAPQAFVAPLPRRLLGHPNGGALAIIGHVERAWGCSIQWPSAGTQIAGFEDALGALMDGKPVGYAMETMNGRYADIASALGAELLEMRAGTKAYDDRTLADQWTANNDARAYVVIGDPAARLRFADPAVHVPDRPTLGVLSSSPQSSPTLPEAPPLSDPVPPLEKEFVVPQPSQPSSNNSSVTLTLPLQITISVGLGEAAGGNVRATIGNGSPAKAQPDSFAVDIDPDYSNREGYDPDFLGTAGGGVPLPRLSPKQLADAAVVDGQPGQHELKYHHFSVVLNAKRRFAFFTAVNIDGRLAGRPTREPDKWSYDPRVPETAQVGASWYAGNDFDLGHLVRRLDPAWGRTPAVIKRANDDTFHLANCSSQHKLFNRGRNLWAGLEDYLLNKVTDDRRRMTVFTGPVFTAADPEFHGVRVPKKFWKIAAVARPNGRVAALGFVVDQSDLVGQVVSFDNAAVARTFQVPIRRIEQITGLNFGALAGADAGTIDSFAANASAGRELSAFEEIVLPTAPTATAPTAFDTTAILASETVDGTNQRYYLIAYDENGKERTDHPAGLISRLVDGAVTDPAVTDVMLFSHGWQGDVPAAREQYTGWLRAMSANDADQARARLVRPGFKPVLVGIHWPSLAWGDENLSPASFAFDAAAGPAGEGSTAAAIEAFAGRLGDTPEVRERVRTPLRRVFELAAAQADPNLPALPSELVDAYRQLDAAIGLGAQDLGADPGSDREGFDPDGIYQSVLADTGAGRASDAGPMAFGGWLSKDSLLAPLRALTFWKMKDRARKIGENAVHPLLVRLQQATAGRDVRFHLVGHSFGCLVVTAAVAGPNATGNLPQPVQSLTLLQGALSLWSYAGSISQVGGRPGFYHDMIAQHRVSGAIVTTRSKFDTAVGKWYPWAARVARAVDFAAGELPKYGGLGAFGIQGSDLPIVDLTMLPTSGVYTLAHGSISNVEASGYINVGGGFSGAHSDIRKPEVAHLVWAAITG
jgi:DNA/RNA endonuclease G (NUC1)